MTSGKVRAHARLSLSVKLQRVHKLWDYYINLLVAKKNSCLDHGTTNLSSVLLNFHFFQSYNVISHKYLAHFPWGKMHTAPTSAFKSRRSPTESSPVTLFSGLPSGDFQITGRLGPTFFRLGLPSFSLAEVLSEMLDFFLPQLELFKGEKMRLGASRTTAALAFEVPSAHPSARRQVLIAALPAPFPGRLGESEGKPFM